MRATEYVKKIMDLVEEHGDIEVKTQYWNTEFGDPNEPYFMKKVYRSKYGKDKDKFSEDCIMLDDYVGGL